MAESSTPYQHIVDRLHNQSKFYIEQEKEIYKLEKDILDLSKKHEHTNDKKTQEKISSINKKLQNLKKQRTTTPDVIHIRQKLLHLGFTKRAYKELVLLMEYGDFHQARESAWELALWHANQYTVDDARLCLYLLRAASVAVEDIARLEALTIIKSECFDLLDKKDEAWQALNDMLDKHPSVDLYLAAVNLEDELKDKIKWINKSLSCQGLDKISYKKNKSDSTYYDCLEPKKSRKKNTVNKKGDHKVTIIVPSFNVADTIATTLDSLLVQTWSNLEIIVVDDCSTDNTFEIVEKYSKLDNRIRLLQTEFNSGSYVARNVALRYTDSEFITVNDADDWSHPTKIEIQVKHLLEHPEIMGNLPQRARTFNELYFYRRGNPGYYIQTDASSLMFRHSVLDKLGNWDSVRFGADTEFIRRLTKLYGEHSLKHLENSLLSFARQSANSLTGGGAFAYHGFFMGARKEYRDMQLYQQNNGGALYYEFPMETRPFAIPEPMQPVRETSENGSRKLDIVIASDFRIPNKCIEEIKYHYNKGKRVGLVQSYLYEAGKDISTDHHILKMLNDGIAEIVVYGERVDCDGLIIWQPWSLQEYQAYLPTINTESIIMVMDLSFAHTKGLQPDKIEVGYICHSLHELLGIEKNTSPAWYPLTSNDRSLLNENYSQVLKTINLSNKNWVVARKEAV
jgi:glycosyltransferase involved in cell wall biosynthesis